MYRRPRFLEILHEIREEMSREADYDMDLFAEMVRSGEIKNRQSERKFQLTNLTPPDVETSENEH